LDVIDKQEAQLMLRKLHDAIRREDKYRQLVGRRTAVSCAEGVDVSAGRGIEQHCHCSAF